MIYIVTTLVLFVFWYLNKKSNNRFFNQKEQIIRNKLELCEKVLINFEWSKKDVVRFKVACEYFISNPSQYNGTSVINDNWVIKNLEPESVIHDYDWIMATSLRQLLISNLEYARRLRKRNVNWFWCWGFIFVGLNIVSLFKSLKYILK